jgi:hypothetical protein
MKTLTAIAFAAILVFAVSALGADNSGRIFGRLTTIDGEEFTGLIRWDKNEVCWFDVLDGTKDLDDRYGDDDRRRERRKRKIEIFGITVSDESSDWNWTSSAQSGVRFGHIRMLEVIDDQEALIELKSGHTVHLLQGSTDIGEDIREIIIEDDEEGQVELVWDDIETIEFMAADTDWPSTFGERLYGTLLTRRGDEYTGWVCWDIDEVFTSDVLDGEEKRRKRKIEFGQIAAIERYSSNGATVRLQNGEEVLLRGTNDVDDGNRGIIISDPGFGQVRVGWDEFERLDFKSAPRMPRYDDFDGGSRLYGTVYTEEGDEYTGNIRWDDDESYGWELIDGDNRDIEFDIELSLIKEIRKRSYRSSIISVNDGREFRLRGSNDVDEDNKGIFIELDNGDIIEIDWEEFERVEFTRR